MAPDYRDQRQWGVPARRAVRHWVRPFCMVLFLTRQGVRPDAAKVEFAPIRFRATPCSRICGLPGLIHSRSAS